MKSKMLTAAVAIALTATFAVPALFHKTAAAAGGVPRFEPDPYWPKPLPNNWISGGIGGIYVDSQDHIWVSNRPRSVDKAVKNAAIESATRGLLHPRASCSGVRYAREPHTGMGRTR